MKNKPTIADLEKLLGKPHKGYFILPDGQIRSCQDGHAEWLDSFADKIRAALNTYGYQEQEGDEGEEDVVRSLVALIEERKEKAEAEAAALRKERDEYKQKCEATPYCSRSEYSRVIERAEKAERERDECRRNHAQ